MPITYTTVAQSGFEWKAWALLGLFNFHSLYRLIHLVLICNVKLRPRWAWDIKKIPEPTYMEVFIHVSLCSHFGRTLVVLWSHFDCTSYSECPFVAWSRSRLRSIPNLSQPLSSLNRMIFFYHPIRRWWSSVKNNQLRQLHDHSRKAHQ